MRSIITLLLLKFMICNLNAGNRVTIHRNGTYHNYVGVKWMLIIEETPSHITFEGYMDEMRRKTPFSGSTIVRNKKHFTLESSAFIGDTGNPLAHKFFSYHSQRMSYYVYFGWYQQNYQLPLTQTESLKYAQQAMQVFEIPTHQPW